MPSFRPSFYMLWALLSVLPACRSDAGTGDPLGPGTGSLITREIQSGGRTRSYQLYVPPSIVPGAGSPLMIALHGNPGTSNTIRQISGFEQVADDVAFLVAFPEATTDWNEGCGCSAAEAAGVDDVQFVRDLIDAVHAEVGVDRTSVFAAGFSQGGLFAEHLACRMTDALAGVAVVAATMSMPLASACAPSRSVPILILHGDLDSVFPESGTDDGDFSVLPIRSAVDLWVRLNGCVGEPETRIIDRVEADLTTLSIEWHRDCAEGSEVAFYRVLNGGHTWPGSPVTFTSGLTSQEISAQEEIVLFFLSHRGRGSP